MPTDDLWIQEAAARIVREAKDFGPLTEKGMRAELRAAERRGMMEATFIAAKAIDSPTRQTTRMLDAIRSAAEGSSE